MERHHFLRILHASIKDKTKILLNKRLVTIENHQDRVIANCEDGSSYDGDIIAGADGVRSKTRSEMWRLAEKDEPVLVQEDKKSMSTRL
jgi:2-polyprenyl-6-methoxyphenol hydroxylase-like FAD-dependent oxidoreductase